MKISRRKFLNLIGSFAGAASLGCLNRQPGLPTELPQAGTPPTDVPPSEIPQALVGDPTRIYLPQVTKQSGSTDLGPKVIHVHNASATHWDYSTSWYGDSVDQSVVNTMADEGLKQLTGKATVLEAWQVLLPDYSAGKKIAIKVNFNNTVSCSDPENRIDALIQPVIALIRGMKTMGVHEDDIWVYDAIRPIPLRFITPCHDLYPEVCFWGDPGCGALASPWGSNAADAFVTFHPPSGVAISPIRLTDVLVNATYLINMPIMKPHPYPGVTLSFKNHFGTIVSPSLLHNYVNLESSEYNSSYNPLVDIYKNPNIVNKTALLVGDGLFAGKTYNNPPEKWTTFGNTAPNSLFFSVDPVAIDCVMYDLLAAEMTIPAKADDYLHLAYDAGLGTYEHGAPWGSGYSKIDYIKI